MLFSRKLQISHDSVIQMKHLLAAIFLHLTTQRAGCMFTGFFKFQSLTWPSFPSWRLTSESTMRHHHLVKVVGGLMCLQIAQLQGAEPPGHSDPQWHTEAILGDDGGRVAGKHSQPRFPAAPISPNPSQPLHTEEHHEFPSGLNSMLVTYLSRHLLFIFPFP